MFDIALDLVLNNQQWLVYHKTKAKQNTCPWLGNTYKATSSYLYGDEARQTVKC